MMFKKGPKFHNIAAGGTFNLNRPTGEVSAGASRQIRLEKFYDRVAFLVEVFRPVSLAAMLAGNGWRISFQEQISQWGFRSDLIVARLPLRTCRP